MGYPNAVYDNAFQHIASLANIGFSLPTNANMRRIQHIAEDFLAVSGPNVFIQVLEWRSGEAVGKEAWCSDLVDAHHYPMSPNGWARALAKQEEINSQEYNQGHEYKRSAGIPLIRGQGGQRG